MAGWAIEMLLCCDVRGAVGRAAFAPMYSVMLLRVVEPMHVVPFL